MIYYRHTGIIVSNINKSKKFYCNLLGLSILQEITESGDYFNNLIGTKNQKAKVLKAESKDGVYVELIQFCKPKKKINNSNFDTIGKIHLCFTVKNIKKKFLQLKQKKIKFISPPLASDFDNVKTCFCYDPDFNLIQFVEGKKIKKIK